MRPARIILHQPIHRNILDKRLAQALEEKNTEELEYLQTLGMNLNNYLGRMVAQTPLPKATIILLLRVHGIDPVYAISAALLKGDISRILFLEEQGLIFSPRSILEQGLLSNNLSFVKLAVQRHMPINRVCVNETLLLSDNREILAYLIDQLPERRFLREINLGLQVAVAYYSVEIAELFLQRGAQTADDVLSLAIDRAFNEDAKDGGVPLVRSLLDHGAVPETGIKKAIANGQLNVVQLLVEKAQFNQSFIREAISLARDIGTKAIKDFLASVDQSEVFVTP